MHLSIQGGSLCFSFFCLLVSSVFNFCPHQKVWWWTFFKAHLFTRAVGREEHCKQISLACVASAPSVSGTLGLPPLNGMCAFPVYPVQALGCSAGNYLRQALVCMHFPGPSRSGDRVSGEHSRSYLLPLLSLLLSFLGVQPVRLLRRILTIQNPKKAWLATKPACSLVDDASLGPRLPPTSSGCPCSPIPGRA